MARRQQPSTAMLAEVAVHDLAAGSKQLLQASDNKGGLSSSSSAHLQRTLRLRDGGRHLLLGRNGCGKTTLLRAAASGDLPGWPKDLTTYLVDQELSIDVALSPLQWVLRANRVVHDLHEEAKRLEARLSGGESEASAASARLCEVYKELETVAPEGEEVRQHRAVSLLRGLGFSAPSVNKPLAKLSGGWRMRAAIAAALFLKPRLLMLDEPTNHLDLGAIEWLQTHLAEEYEGTLLCVSHDRAFVDAVCTDVIIFADKSLSYFNGTLTAFEAAAADRARHLEREASNLERKQDQLRSAMQSLEQRCANEDKNRAAHKAKSDRAHFQAAFEGSQRCSAIAAKKKQLQRSGIEKAEDGKRFKMCEHGNRIGSMADNEGGWVNGKMTAAPLLQKKDPSLRFGFPSGESLGLCDGAPLLQLNNVSFTYPGASQPALRDVDLSLDPRCRIAIQGRNGAGKSTLLKLLTGEVEPTTGTVSLHRNLKVAVQTQHATDALAKIELSALKHFEELFPERSRLELRTLLGSFGLAGSVVGQPLSTLSGGQRVRVLLAKLSVAKPHLLVLDEPTNHLDIYSIEALIDSLKDFQGGVILVTHNRRMIQEVANELFIVSALSHTLALASRAIPDGPRLEIPPLEELPELAEVEDGGPPLTELVQKKDLPTSDTAPRQPKDGANTPAKKALPPWLRR